MTREARHAAGRRVARVVGIWVAVFGPLGALAALLEVGWLQAAITVNRVRALALALARQPPALVSGP